MYVLPLKKSWNLKGSSLATWNLAPPSLRRKPRARVLSLILNLQFSLNSQHSHISSNSTAHIWMWSHKIMTLSHYCKSMWLSLLLASYNGKVLIESLAHTDSDPDETSSDPDCFTEPWTWSWQKKSVPPPPFSRNINDVSWCFDKQGSFVPWTLR